MDQHDKQAQEVADLLRDLTVTLQPHQLEIMAHIMRTRDPSRNAPTAAPSHSLFITHAISTGCRQVRPHRVKT